MTNELRKSNFMPRQQSLHGYVILLLAVLLTCAVPMPGKAVTPNTTPVARQTLSHHQKAKGTFEMFPLNIAIFRAINNHHTPVVDRIAEYLDTLGLNRFGLTDIGFGWVLLPILLYTYFRRRHLFLALVLALAIETMIIVLMKQIWNHPRPGVVLEHVHQVLQLGQNSFPSGHTAMMCVITCIMWYRERWWCRLGWLLATLLIAYQRMYVGVHFPLDIFVGLLIGIVAAGITYAFLYKKIEQQWEKRKV